MATQRDVQQLIQGLTPSAVNNGNPNTVYNTPVPTVDALGRWTMPTVNPAASRPALNLPAISTTLAGWVPPASGTSPGIQGPILPQMPPMAPPGSGGGGGGVIPSPPPVQPPVLPPGTPPSTGTPGLGSPVMPPSTIEPGWPVTSAPPPATVGGGGTGPFGWGRPLYGPGLTGAGGGAGGSGGGNFSWQQLLDIISEPFLPGDHYLENSGEWSKGNVAKGVLDSILPGLGTAGEWAYGKADPDGYFNHLMQIANNKMAGNQNDVQNDTNARVATEIQKKLDEMFGQAPDSGGSTRGRGRQSAGASTIAEGAAAQRMVGDMQLNQFLKQLLRTGTMDRRYTVER